MPHIGQAITGFAPAIYPNAGGTVGGVSGGTIGGSNTFPGTSGSTSAPISGQRSELVTFFDALNIQICRLLEHNLIYNFFDVALERCHNLPWLIEFGYVVLSCLTFSRSTFIFIFLQKFHPYNRESRAYYCSRQLFIQCSGSGNLSID